MSSIISSVFQQQTSTYVPAQLTQLNHHYMPYDHTLLWLDQVNYSPLADDSANIHLDDFLLTGTGSSSSSSSSADSSMSSTTRCWDYCQLFDECYNENSLYNACWDSYATSSNVLDVAPENTWFHGHRTFDYGSENNTTTITKVARYPAEERRDKILRYLKKKNQRNFRKTIKYACRKTLADRRVRIRGRFAKNQDEEFHANSYINQQDQVNTELPDLGVHKNYSYCDEDWLQEAMETLMHASVAGPYVR